MLKKLWNDEAGLIVSAELALVLTIGVLAMVVGLLATMLGLPTFSLAADDTKLGAADHTTLLRYARDTWASFVAMTDPVTVRALTAADVARVADI